MTLIIIYAKVNSVVTISTPRSDKELIHTISYALLLNKKMEHEKVGRISTKRRRMSSKLEVNGRASKRKGNDK